MWECLKVYLSLGGSYLEIKLGFSKIIKQFLLKQIHNLIF